MSILKDKTFENMDWLSQAIEPYHCDINDVLALMPDEYVVEVSDILTAISARSYQAALQTYDVVRRLYDKLTMVPDSNGTKWLQNTVLTYDERDMMQKCFVFKSNGPISIDGEAGTMTGEIKLIKIKNIIDEKDVKKLMKRYNVLGLRPTDCQASALTDLGTLLLEGSSVFADFTSAKGNKAKYRFIAEYMRNSVDNDSFKIRSLSAYRKFVGVITHFLQTKNPKSLAEIYRVVMMAKRGQVIYSVN